MQSGLATNKFWILKYISYSKTNLDPLMGWSGSDDTSKQIVLKFNSKEEAIDYAELHSLKYRILNNNSKTIKPKSYADNFSFKFNYNGIYCTCNYDWFLLANVSN